MTHQQKLENRRLVWDERICQFQESGQSGAAWAKEQGISVHQLRYWYRTLTGQPITKARSNTQTWVELPVASTMESSSHGSGITLRCGSLLIDVDRGFDPQVLADVVQTLQGT